MQRDELRRYLNDLLDASRFRDYCPNGLQVEGRGEIVRAVCGVTASLALLDAAIERDADAIIVHHGWFWRGEDGTVTGTRKSRLARLLAHDINLYAYHLPLDAHPDLGNNAGLARAMGWQTTGRFGDQDIGCVGEPSGGALLSARAHCDQIAARLGREAMLVGDATRKPVRVAWCTGGAQGLFEQAIAAGAEMFVSGEISEQTVHLARESGVPFIAAGHHATERFGVRSLGEHLTRNAGIACEFIDIDNPV
ncbi:MAG TPA: Nif3-like dinuclear metal center hexameric protein [Rhodocyclaceae bacterium]|nr:Nif3-like dinuclear metal center hexameric protein [Rhodocyclaceae bacterium]HMV55428.1 Nif3-like dinuclear metal center hexameric protein [Rhodocyclaceae bacterium]HMZ83032.1 Nif3-like dinuclear metal center hexameric protein [Rhodocyclaceae bacterium]HNA03116.1 Nif3-like dinuclear metal center hexameric protein [Rhodocyclaceae bacterium]HNB78426.1 Nif3-like dinuclear metal center hexameric protein [Rhodocyclaceae bacterium]